MGFDLKTLAGGCLAACIAGVAHAAVIYEDSGRSSEWGGIGPLPTPGTYKFEFKSTAPTPWYWKITYYEHEDNYVLPIPRPHSESFAYRYYPVELWYEQYDSNVVFYFEVPEPFSYYFTTNNSHTAWGVAPGTPAYHTFEYDDVRFEIYGGTLGYDEDTRQSEQMNYSIRVTKLSATPEPSVWAMLLLGFGGAGALLRRRNQRLRASA